MEGLNRYFFYKIPDAPECIKKPDKQLNPLLSPQQLQHAGMPKGMPHMLVQGLHPLPPPGCLPQPAQKTHTSLGPVETPLATGHECGAHLLSLAAAQKYTIMCAIEKMLTMP